MRDTRPGWRIDLDSRAAEAPRVARRPLFLDGVDAPVGSIEPALADAIRAAGMPLEMRAGTEHIVGAADAALARIAHWLSVQGLCGTWRDELLPVMDEALVRHAVIERAAVRPLGIATLAVHLIGFAPQGDVWVQQRALDKATDPGRWDTLVGGLVAADEDPALALERETWEEAGLRVGELPLLAKVDRITIRRPVREGYMVEYIDVFEGVVPAGVHPVNQDGEVARFECMTRNGLVAQLAADTFTLEAALMLARSLERRRPPE